MRVTNIFIIEFNNNLMYSNTRYYTRIIRHLYMDLKSHDIIPYRRENGNHND